MLKKAMVAALLGAVPYPGSGQQALEIISLRHRTVEQVLPVLRPLLEPGATLTGQRGQLIVRTSPENLAHLRQALAAIDRPLRRLQISVRFQEAANSVGREIGAGGRIGQRGTRVDVYARDAQGAGTERVDQRIQVLEGGRARIMTGQTTPLPGGVWETATGFEAVPRLSGDTVLLDIAPQKQSLDTQQSMATTVSARLGEWFEVGAVVSQAVHEERGLASRSRSASAASERIWLKVEELAP